MSTSRHLNKICCIVTALSLLLTFLLMNAASFDAIPASSHTMGYENRLFDQSAVHTLDIVMDDWDGFLSTCTSEEYSACSVVIDGEAYKNVGIRGKGNTSLTSVADYGNNRYSFKIEFDKYNEGGSYYGLDKLSLNNIIQDNTYMKDYLCYTLMNQMGVSSPLCSFVYITVNGEDWGLYLAVEGVEDGFLQRNYGSGYGNLYKPDSTGFGGGRPVSDSPEVDTEMPDDGDPKLNTESRDNNRAAFDMGSDDVKLQYIDDDPDSYSNIFNNAKTDISSEDQERLIASLEKLSKGEDIESVVDVDAVIRYLVVHNFVCNGDSYTGSMVHNYYLYEKDGVLSMIPWDYNLAFGGFSGGMGGGMKDGMNGGMNGGAKGAMENGMNDSMNDANVSDSQTTSEVNSPIDSPVDGELESRPMAAWIFADESYTELYHQYYQEFITDCFDSGYFEEMIDNVASLIDPYVQKDPTAFCTYEEFQTGVQTLKCFCLLRAESVRGQLDSSIPSTDEGQSADTAALIDASDINLSDMGSMNGGGGDMGAPGGGMDNPDGNNRTDFGGSMDQSNRNSMTVPEVSHNVAASPTTANTAALLALSFAVLLLGLIFAVRYRR